MERRHFRFKRAVAQELMLSGSADFASVDEYRRFLSSMFERLNNGRGQRLAEEMAVMKELPERRVESARRERAKVETVNVPVEGNVDLMMDFTDPIICGTSPFHCHLLSH